MARLRVPTFLKPRLKEGHAVVDLSGIERYWREANGGDPYFELYHRARTLASSNDNVPKQNRLHTLVQMVDRVVAEALPGDVVECGCWKGHSTYMMADRLRAAGWAGRMFVFDSFEGGLSDKVAADRIGRGDTDPEKTLEQKLRFASNQEQVQALLAPFPFVSLHKGWIPAVFDTVAGLAERTFSLVHIDVDLYEPTRDSLDFFGPRMVDNGLLVIDDYGAANFPGCKAAVDEYRARRKPKFFLESHLIGAVMMV